MTQEPRGDAGPEARAEARGNGQWVLASLPLLPFVLLGARLWYLSKQDLQTTLLLIQEINPLGLITALVLSLIWLLPALLLAITLIGALLRVSVPEEEVAGHWLHRYGRFPAWVVGGSILIALFTWQLRFLPTLLMLALVIVALFVRERVEGPKVWILAFVVPGVLMIVAYVVLADVIRASWNAGDYATTALFAVPPFATLLLTGPLPGRGARVVTRWPIALMSFSPLLVTVVFINTPILPFFSLAIDTGTAGKPDITVRQGYVIAVDDRMTTLLDGQGYVHFFLNDRIVAKALCSTESAAPANEPTVRDWSVEETVLSLLPPARPALATDPLCVGRYRPAE